MAEDPIAEFQRAFAAGFGYPDPAETLEPWAVDAEENFTQVVLALFDDAADLLLSKHHDYGPHNVGRSPGGALNGLRVRLWDKLARLNNLVDTGADPKHEALEDTLIDMANYALIGVLVCRGQWPTE